MSIGEDRPEGAYGDAQRGYNRTAAAVEGGLKMAATEPAAGEQAMSTLDIELEQLEKTVELLYIRLSIVTNGSQNAERDEAESEPRPPEPPESIVTKQIREKAEYARWIRNSIERLIRSIDI